MTSPTAAVGSPAVPAALPRPAVASVGRLRAAGALALALAAMSATGASAEGTPAVTTPAAVDSPRLDPGPPPGDRWLAGAVSGAALVGAVAVAAGGSWQVPVEAFGAVGDGVHDDTAALQEAFDAVPTGTTLTLRPGATYLHSSILTVRTAGTTVLGDGATLVAADEEASTLRLAADSVTVEGLTLTTPSITQRWDPFETTGVWVTGDSAVLRDVHVRGAGGAGIAVTDGAGDFLLDRVTVADSRADGIHITGAAHDGRVVSPVTTGTGDDGVAVVSYTKDGAPCERVTIESPTVNGTTWGRGVTVVGGNDITYTDVTVRDTDAAGIYVGSEGDPYWTYPSVGVLVDGGTVTGANDNPDKDHGAVLVYAGNPGTTTADVTIRGLTIDDTRASAPWDTGVLVAPGSGAEQITLSDLRLDAGPDDAFWTNEPSSVRVSELTRDGTAVPAQRGW
ncbi:glycosyl hydrolase family 28-related protein [Modestobacter sp. SYSU DS0290]